ncbi:MAG: hypothetical protein GY925_26435, partial [Actinomycetia bacterium]|nr:hypothetical protein [Actinomycetes bacterium]
MTALLALLLALVALAGDAGRPEVVDLSDFPRLEHETTDNGRIGRWLSAEPRSVHRWAGVLQVAAPGIREWRPRHLEGVCGSQGNAMYGTRLVPVGEWTEEQAVLTLTARTVLRCLVIQAAVDDGESATDPGYGLVVRKGHGSQLEHVMVYGLRAGMDPDSLATGRRWRGARRAGVYTDWLNGGTLNDIVVRQVEGVGVLLSQTNGVSADINVSIGHSDGVLVWGSKPHPWSAYPGGESGSGLELHLRAEALDGWALRCSGSERAMIRGGYVEQTEGGIWLHGCPWWSINMPRAGNRPLRLTGTSWGTRIEWLMGVGLWEYEDGRRVYSPIELGYWLKGSARRRVPRSWLIG